LKEGEISGIPEVTSVSRRVAARFPYLVTCVLDVCWPTARGASRRRTVLQAREAPRRPSPLGHPPYTRSPRATPSVAVMRLRHHPRRVLSPAPCGGVVPPPTVTRRILRGPVPYTWPRRGMTGWWYGYPNRNSESQRDACDAYVASAHVIHTTHRAARLVRVTVTGANERVVTRESRIRARPSENEAGKLQRHEAVFPGF